MHHFRYRSISEISLKELMYNEMFFASPEECNDPFDSKAFYEFKSNKNKFRKLILFANEQVKLPISENHIDRLTNHICKLCPISFDDAIEQSLFEDFNNNSQEEIKITTIISNRIQQILKLYKPPTRYFVSFSKTNSEPLMWSHYADRHKGFCLIFKSINGKLLQSHTQKKGQIRRKTPNGFAEDMSFAMPENFKFKDIDYKSKVKQLDGFLHLPVYVNGDAKNQEEKKKVFELQQKHYSQKGKSWSYEKETRLILNPPPSFLFGEHVNYTQQERLFHYEPSQLVGIIYGAKMDLKQKQRIDEILRERKDFIDCNHNYKRTIFNFVEFQAKLSTNQREVQISPICIRNYQKIKPNDKDFNRLFKEWNNGIGYEREKNSSKRIQVK